MKALITKVYVTEGVRGRTRILIIGSYDVAFCSDNQYTVHIYTILVLYVSY